MQNDKNRETRNEGIVNLLGQRESLRHEVESSLKIVPRAGLSVILALRGLLSLFLKGSFASVNTFWRQLWLFRWKGVPGRG